MEDKIRTFIAIELGDHVLQAIASYSRQLQARFPRGFRWVKPDLMHLTMNFLGDVPLGHINQISQKLEEKSKQILPFQLQIDGTGAFPSWRKPRTIWIGIAHSQKLLDLHKQLESVLVESGIPAEDRPFSAHLTLCRVSDYADPAAVKQLENLLGSTPLAANLVWDVHDVVLFKSKLQPGGPVYSILSKYQFRSPVKV
jgi:2'-5' RNA ligase